MTEKKLDESQIPPITFDLKVGKADETPASNVNRIKFASDVAATPSAAGVSVTDLGGGVVEQKVSLPPAVKITADGATIVPDVGTIRFPGTTVVDMGGGVAEVQVPLSTGGGGSQAAVLVYPPGFFVGLAISSGGSNITVQAGARTVGVNGTIMYWTNPSDLMIGQNGENGVAPGWGITNTGWWAIWMCKGKVGGGSSHVFLLATYGTAETDLTDHTGTNIVLEDYRRIGAFYRTAAGSVVPFVQVQDEVRYLPVPASKLPVASTAPSAANPIRLISPLKTYGSFSLWSSTNFAASDFTLSSYSSLGVDNVYRLGWKPAPVFVPPTAQNSLVDVTAVVLGSNVWMFLASTSLASEGGYPAAFGGLLPAPIVDYTLSGYAPSQAWQAGLTGQSVNSMRLPCVGGQIYFDIMYRTGPWNTAHSALAYNTHEWFSIWVNGYKDVL